MEGRREEEWREGGGTKEAVDRRPTKSLYVSNYIQPVFSLYIVCLMCRKRILYIARDL